MIDKKIIITSTVSNAQDFLYPFFENVKKISKLFTDVKCIIVESNSTDNTIDILKDVKKNIYDFDGYSMGVISSNSRTDRIATSRNYYLDIVETQYLDYDYLLVMDANQTNIDVIDDKAIESNFQHNGWDMMCANQSILYYDLWALRHDYLMPDDCWTKIWNKPSFMSIEDAKNIWLTSRFINIPSNHPPIKVESAFGGSAFIDISKIKGARHTGITRHGTEICEWVEFCRSLNNGNSKIFINPKFINQQSRNTHTLCKE